MTNSIYIIDSSENKIFVFSGRFVALVLGLRFSKLGSLANKI